MCCWGRFPPSDKKMKTNSKLISELHDAELYAFRHDVASSTG